MANTLTNNDLIRAARQLGCEVAVIRAVDSVESSGAGFDSKGRVKIRFETHIFRDGVSGGSFKGTGITINGSDYAAFNKAFALNPYAAMMSTSWGRYQIMGFNYAACGYASVDDFVTAMKQGEPQQLNAFVSLLLNWGLADELARKDWPAFKRRYNGPAPNDYVPKLIDAYARFAGQPFPATNTPVIKKKPLPRPKPS